MDFATSYVTLGLRLGRHIDGLVDAYFGPAEPAAQVDSEQPRDPAELVAEAVTLGETLDDAGLEPQRARWLRSQLIGLETVARKLAGEEIAYEDEVERCYGVRPKRVPEKVFEAAHRELDEVLPGTGSVAERYQAWREGDGLQGESLARVTERLAADFRARTSSLVGLPPGESVDVEYVTDEPWAAFNYYLGGLRSRVAVNTDVSLTPTFLTELVAHETYPGHHTERVWKEELLVRERDQPEETILLIGTPQSLIAEGIAGLAPEILLSDEEQEVTAASVRGTSVAYDPDVSRAAQRARIPLADVPGNVAFLLAEGVSVEEAEAYVRRWGLTSEKRARQALRFATDPTWRAYGTTYTDGYRLCREWVGGDAERFKRLLREQLTPADLT
jgi:hypothetical protein